MKNYISPKGVEEMAKNDIKELLDELVVSPIKHSFPDALKKTEAAIQKSIDEKTKNNSDPSSIAFKVKDTLIFSNDFLDKIADASGAENIDDIKDDIEDLKDNVDELKNDFDNVVTKTDQLSASATEAHDNITKLIEALIEEVEAQREMIEKQTETIEQQHAIIEKYVSEMTSANNKLNRMNRQIWKICK